MQLLEILDGNHPQYLRRLENTLHWDRLYTRNKKGDCFLQRPVATSSANVLVKETQLALYVCRN